MRRAATTLALVVAVAGACGGTANTATPEVDAGSAPTLDASVPPPRDAGQRPDASPPLRDAAIDHDPGKPTDTYPAFKPPVPQAASAGGSVMKAPKIVAVTFKNDPLAAAIEDFTQTIGASSYWTAVSAEYGVGAASALPPVRLTETVPAVVSSNHALELIKAKVHAGTFPAPDENTIYALFYPPGTAIEAGYTESCVGFAEDHTQGVTYGGDKFVVAIVPRCPRLGSRTGMDALSFAASKAYLEAATNPYPRTAPAYDRVSDDHVAWEDVFPRELGDLCAWKPDLGLVPPGLPYNVQRSWSNLSAAGLHHPCVPIPAGEVYFNAAPALSDRHGVYVHDRHVNTRVVNVPFGTTRTIDLQLFSDGPTGGPWTVSVHEPALFGGGSLELHLDRNQGQNGEKLALTITAIDPYASTSMFIIVNTLNGQRTYWPVLVSH